MKTFEEALAKAQEWRKDGACGPAAEVAIALLNEMDKQTAADLVREFLICHETSQPVTMDLADRARAMLQAPSAEGMRETALMLYWRDSAAANGREVARLMEIINSPQSGDFLRAVSTEAEHQRQRWGSSHDAGKAAADWFWLVGYLAGKALHAHAAGDLIKAEHHIITTAAALMNWHKAMFGQTDMRPGIDGEKAMGGAV